MDQNLSSGALIERSIPSLSTAINSLLLQWMYSKIVNHLQNNVLRLEICNNPYSAIFSQHNSIKKADSFSEIKNKANGEWSNYFNTVFFWAQEPITKTQSKEVDKILHPDGFMITWWQVHNALFGEYDGGINFWHKSNKAEIMKALPNNYKIEKMRYLNIVDTISEYKGESPSLYHESVPQFRSENQPDFNKGLSALVFAKKN